MITSLAYIIIVGLVAAGICQLIKIPRIIGMLFVGIILGPNCLNCLDSSILNIAKDLRQIALIIILIKAGLSLNLSDLKPIGRPAILMSMIPACFEMLGFILFGPSVLHITVLEAAIIGAVLGAVSPAIVVPRMTSFIEAKWGTNKSIPQLILAGASCDDIFVIVIFTSLIHMAQGQGITAKDFTSIPISITCGIAIGALLGYILARCFEVVHNMHHTVRNTEKTIVVLGSAFLLVALEDKLKDIIPISGLLAATSMACVLKAKAPEVVSTRLSEKFGKLWLGAEVILFVLVGAAIDVKYSVETGGTAVAMILLALLFRSVGVTLCLFKTPLNFKEKLFCALSYIPKATVQAAIGSIPLALGLPCGKMVLSIATISILITAPLGAIAIDISYKKLLVHSDSE